MTNKNEYISTEGVKQFLEYLNENLVSLTDNEKDDFLTLGTPVKLSKGEVFLS